MDRHQAIYKLYPNVKYINSEIPYDENNNVVSVDENAITIEIDKVAYINKRISAYKPLAEQLDMQYWDRVNGTDTWKQHIDAVKTAHPKPTE
jgi:hypothetical protein